ncbi:MAG: eight-cysteine-cluster domain-containing protein [Candidatus Woesearchaeota archaeon]
MVVVTVRSGIYIILLVSLILIIAGCSEIDETTTSLATDQIECNSDDECAIGGCSSQLCILKTDQDIGGGFFSTCEYKEEYGCVKLTECSCVKGICQWKQNDEFTECLDDARNE